MNTNDLTTQNKNNTKAAEAPTTQEQNAASTVHSPSIISNKKATFVTLGCKLNYAETSTLRDRLTARGCMPAEEKETADICIVNTCSVTGEADAKCRHAIRSLHREHPNAFIAVMGCYAQLSGEDIAKIEGVDLVVGQEQKGRIIELIEEHYEAHSMGVKAETESHGGIFYTTPLKDIKTFVPSCSRGERTRYFLKVQDGCNYFCTYCTIPAARGLSRNATIADVVAQAEDAAAAGGREIVLTGVNIGDFGRSTGENFFQLVQALDQVEGIARYRISSIEPNLLTDEIVDYCSKSRAFMPHFHIPLQSGSDGVLKLMQRHYDTALFRSKVELIRRIDAAAAGGREIVLTGVNIGDFGRSTGENFFQLVQALDQVEGIARYRISSIEPNLLTDEIVDYCSKSRAFMPHFHIPLQSGSDGVLKLMQRHYDTALFRSKVELIRRIMPDAFIGVDVIVGTRGETDEFFEEAYEFIASLPISQLHVFSYSERPGTAALRIPHVVDAQAKRERSKRLLALSEEKRKAHYRQFIGAERTVLWEHLREGKPLMGWTDNYIRVQLAEGATPHPDELDRVRLGDFTENEDALIATPVG